MHRRLSLMMSVSYGKRLLCNVLHEEALKNPNRLFAIVYKSNNDADQFERVTFKQVAAVVSNVSHWLQKLFDGGRKPTGHPTIAYCGLPDLRYSIIVLASFQCGYQIFLPSTKNTNSVNIALLKETGCRRMVYSSEVIPLVTSLQESLLDVQFEQFDDLETLLTQPETNYPYDAKYEDVVDEPILILHSSGSTGVPKVVRYTHGTICTLDLRDYGHIEGRLNHDAITTLRFSRQEACAYDMFPPYHLAGVNMKIFVPIYNLTAAIFGPPTRPPSGALVAKIMKVHKPSGACLPPSIIEQLFHEPGGEEIFRHLEILVFTGGPLPKVIGDHICKLTRVAQQYGSSEMGSIRQLLPAREDWQWIEFHPTERLELQPFENGLFELVLFTNTESKGSSWLYHTFPDVTEWRSKDLFERHPDNPDLWRFFGRVDDILVYSSGEKLFPVPMESTLTALPEIKGVLVVGNGFPQSALLAELAENVDTAFVSSERFWTEVEKANVLLPTYGRVSQSMIITSILDRPFVRAGKGTIIRRQTEHIYANEIEELIRGNQVHVEASIIFKPSVFKIEDVQSLVRAVLSRISMTVQISGDENLYEFGLDSVKAAEALGHFKKSLSPYKSSADMNQLTLEFMYLNTTVTQLSSALLSFVNEGRLAYKDRVAEEKAKVKQYTQSNSQSQANETKMNGVKDRKYNVAITGTTGYFGSYILNELLESSNISRVWCLNRSSDASSKLKGHPAASDRLQFFQIDFTADRFGLQDVQYEQLMTDCDLIIHNAWQVDFNRPLSFFEPSLNSIKQLVTLSAESPLHPRILFISSISAAGDFGKPGSAPEIIPEEILTDPDRSMPIGYGESKLVAEQVLNNAALAKIPVTVLRVGSLAPKAGCSWPDAYGLSAFLQTCKASGLIATDLADFIDWLPVDEAAGVVGDIVRHELSNCADSTLRVFNLVHPDPAPRSLTNSAPQSWCDKDAKPVSTQEWVRVLEQQDMSDPSVLEKFPALRMWSVFRLLANRGPTHRYAMENAKAVSKRLKAFTPIDEQVISSWLQQL